MKIGRITSLNPYISRSLQNFKGKIEDMAQYKEQRRKDVPNYHQTACTKNGVTLQGQLDEGVNFKVDLDNDITRNYLTSKNGLINFDWVQKFIQYFSLNLNKEKEFSSNDEKNLSDAANKTVDLFRLSKKEDGYDFSDFEKKERLIEALECTKTENIIAKDDDDFYYQIRKYAKDDDEKLDYEAVYSMLALVSGSYFGLPPKKAITLIKRLYRFDDTQKIRILNSLIRLNETYFHISDENDSAQKLIELCYDSEHNFKKERAEKLFEAVDIAETWLCEQMEITECKSEENEENMFQIQLNMATQAVLECFREYKRNPDLDFEEYINKYLSKFIFF